MSGSGGRGLVAALLIAAVLGAGGWTLFTSMQWKGAAQPMPGDGGVAEAAVTFVDLEELAPLLRNGRWTFVEFGGRTCIPCQQMQPILRGLIEDYGDRMDVVNLYLEDDPAAIRRFGIQLMPTQIVFDTSGEEAVRHLGLWYDDQVRRALADLGIAP